MNDETVHQLCKQAVAQVIWLDVLQYNFHYLNGVSENTLDLP